MQERSETFEGTFAWHQTPEMWKITTNFHKIFSKFAKRSAKAANTFACKTLSRFEITRNHGAWQRQIPSSSVTCERLRQSRGHSITNSQVESGNKTFHRVFASFKHSLRFMKNLRAVLNVKRGAKNVYFRCENKLCVYGTRKCNIKHTKQGRMPWIRAENNEYKA